MNSSQGTLETSVPHEWIEWGAGDEEYGLSVDSFTWKRETIPLSELGDAGFQAFMATYIDIEIRDHLEEIGMCLEENSLEEIESENSRLANWIRMLEAAKSNPNYQFDDEIQVSKHHIDSWDNQRRVIVCDGWHRLGIAFAANLKSVNAYVGYLV